MRKDIHIPYRLLFVSAILLQACGDVVRAKQESSTGTPARIFTPTEIPPTDVLAPTITPYPTPYLLDIPTPTPEVIIPINIPYFSQLDYPNEHFITDGTSWSFAGCGIMVGAMLDKTDPYTYYKDFLKYFAEQKPKIYGEERFSRGGSSYLDHIAVLTSLGHSFVKLSGEDSRFADVKPKIKEYTEKGIPVLVRASVSLGYGRGLEGHITIAVGVDENGNIIYYDPGYGKNATIAESRFAQEFQETDSQTSLEVFAVIPPKTP